MTTPLHCKVCAKPLRGQQCFYCGRPCKRRAYLAQRKLREAQELADRVDAHHANYVFDSWMGELKELGADDKLLLNKHLVDLYVDNVSTINITETGGAITVVVPPGTTASTVATAITAHTEAHNRLPVPTPPSLLRRCYTYIQLLAHTLYHIFDGWRTRK